VRTKQILCAALLTLGTAALLKPAETQALSSEDEPPAGSSIPEEEFLASPAAQFFRSGDFERALEGFDPLLNRYPGDPLLLRYRAMCLDRLGRSKEAVKIYENLLVQNPNHVPALYFLGQAHFRMGELERAARKWQEVGEMGKGTPYAEWAGQALRRFGPALTPPEAEVPRWDFFAASGYEYDSNVVLKPDDKSLATPEDPGSNRYTLNTRLARRLIARPDFLVVGSYEFQQTLHDDGLDEFNFTYQGYALEARKQVRVAGRFVNGGFLYEVLPGFLNGNLFSLSNQWTLSADTRWNPRWRTAVFDRLAVSNFGPDGFNPARTSRDGFYHDLGVTQYWHPWASAVYFFMHEEFTSAFTRGDNFDRLGNTTRVGTHLPLHRRIALDASAGFAFGAYPGFGSLSSLDSDRRRDFTWDLFGTVTYFLTQQWSIRAFYRFVAAQNPNGFFEYDRHIGGIQLQFTQSF